MRNEVPSQALITHPGFGAPLRAVGVAGGITIIVAPFLMRPALAPNLALGGVPFLAIVALALASGVFYAVFFWRVSQRPFWVVLEEDAVEFGGGLSRRQRFRLRELSDVAPIGRRNLLLATLDGPRRVVAFREPEARHALSNRIIETIGAREDGATQLAILEANRRYAAASRFRPSWLAAGFCIVLIGIHTGVAWLGDPESVLLGWANVSSRVFEGEVYRLVTANFLHINLYHVGANAFGIAILGSLVYSLYGRGPLVLVSVLSGLMAMIAALFASRSSAGASGIAYGLLGLLTFGGLLRWRELPALYRPHRFHYLFPLVALLAVEPWLPRVSFAGHLAGFVTGWLVGFRLLRGRTVREQVLGSEVLPLTTSG